MNIGTENYYINHTILMLLIIIFIFVVYIVFWFTTMEPFINEYKYIKMELGRSYDKERYRYWKKELNKLYLRYIPFIGRFFR